MGRILSIRLSAVTYNEEDVFRAWPGLCALAWPGKGDIYGGAWKPAPDSFTPPVKAEPVSHGVVALAHALLEESRLGDWSDGLKKRLEQELAGLNTAVKQLETALADWQPQAANMASNAIEDRLDSLEEKL